MSAKTGQTCNNASPAKREPTLHAPTRVRLRVTLIHPLYRSCVFASDQGTLLGASWSAEPQRFRFASVAKAPKRHNVPRQRVEVAISASDSWQCLSGAFLASLATHGGFWRLFWVSRNAIFQCRSPRNMILSMAKCVEREREFFRPSLPFSFDFTLFHFLASTLDPFLNKHRMPYFAILCHFQGRCACRVKSRRRAWANAAPKPTCKVALSVISVDQVPDLVGSANDTAELECFLP